MQTHNIRTQFLSVLLQLQEALVGVTEPRLIVKHKSDFGDFMVMYTRYKFGDKIVDIQDQKAVHLIHLCEKFLAHLADRTGSTLSEDQIERFFDLLETDVSMYYNDFIDPTGEWLDLSDIPDPIDAAIKFLQHGSNQIDVSYNVSIENTKSKPSLWSIGQQ